MKTDDILCMAREADRWATNQTSDTYEWKVLRDERFAALVATAVREECTKACDQSKGEQSMNTEQERTEFEAWAANIGFSVTGKYAETIDVLCAESAFKAGYKAGRAAQAAQDEALLRQALEALESCDGYIEQLELVVYSPDDTGKHAVRVKVQSTVAALIAALEKEKNNE